MAETDAELTAAPPGEGAPGGDAPEAGAALEGGAYEVLRKRLRGLDKDLCGRLEKLNAKRKETFGGMELKIIGNERIPTENNCVPRDLRSLGDLLVFGFNVYIGLKSETELTDVINTYRFDGSEFHPVAPDALCVGNFERDFQELYKYYKHARFLQFVKTPSRFLIIFQIGEQVEDVKIFRFRLNKDNALEYIDDRGDMDYELPPQHDFEWTPATREDQVAGDHPHVSIKDELFVECIGGDLTIKVENNTDSGEGIYAEPVENRDQTLDDAYIGYAFVGDLILLKMLPYREVNARYFVYSRKHGTVARIDSVEQACIELPEDHGIIFPKGYFLQDGTTRQFDEDVAGMVYLTCIKSPNGEDFLYVFYHPVKGLHVLIQYNLISKEIANPIFCHGYCRYGDGKMVLFSSPDEEPRRHHAMQIWQTPFYADTFDVPQKTDTFLTKIGNRDLVRGVSEAYGISRLITRDGGGLETYQDTITACRSLLDGYHWLDDAEVFNLREVVLEIKSSAVAAVDEYEKVVRIRLGTEAQVKENAEATRQLLLDAQPDGMRAIDDFVDALGGIRSRRGQVISLRDLRYVDLEAVDRLDAQLEDAAEAVSRACVAFLLRDDALAPYLERNGEIAGKIEREVKKVAELAVQEEAIEELAGRLDLLTDVVNNLEIEDATQTTQIVDAITGVYGGVNRTRALARNLRKELGLAEAKAEFAAQYKLLSQSITNYIGMCDTAARADEYMTKVMVTVEELEGRFAEYEEYAEQLAEKREEAYNAFTARKQVLEEGQKRKVGSLLSSAGRILKGVRGRAESFKEVDEINAYFASDLMVAKLRDTIKALHGLGEGVAADDLTGQLKAAKDEILRGLRDKFDLFVEGENVIRFGDYAFTVNTQALELTTVQREGEMLFHLNGTDFYEKIEDADFLATRELWEQTVVSESPEVYRAEYLAYCILDDAAHGEGGLTLEALDLAVHGEGGAALDKLVRDYAAPRYDEGYEKGVHDHDAALILTALVDLYKSCDLLRYDSESRAHAILYWCFCGDGALKDELRNKLKSTGALGRVFGRSEVNRGYVAEVRGAIARFFEGLGFEVAPAVLEQAADYLYHELQDQEELEFTINALALDLHRRFTNHLKKKRAHPDFLADLAALGENTRSRVHLIHDWVSAYVDAQGDEDAAFLVWEVVAIIAADKVIAHDARKISTFRKVEGLLGGHSRVEDKALDIYFDRFLARLKRFASEQVPLFRRYLHLRTELTEARREEMRLSEFQPRVMGAFVRNKLINDVYMDLVGANFAKQMGVAGEAKRTDLMGLLLLISPPGYGKTTLMEYISHRLGLTFMKINGPAIGHNVTSLDPAEAPNATSREELAKLNLSLEMGNNIMIYLDDIQHLNPEFLQKFISLCDAQRKIEGVYRGVTRTYDLRGKKVAVVMAGNPYTESGDKFQIPDMLANRADTYNLGDISSTSEDVFAMSFIENAMTSNPALSKISSHGHEDIYRFMEVVERGTREGVEFAHPYPPEEVNEIVSVLKKLYRVRDVVLRVNQEYIYSAAQEEAYRTEPPFKLQGSYRNMNRMAEKVFPVMTDAEVDQLILDNYINEAQTLTDGAEANLLKFRAMTGQLDGDGAARWEAIKKEFRRRQVLGGDEDAVGKIIVQLGDFNRNLGEVRAAIAEGIERSGATDTHLAKAVEQLGAFAAGAGEIRDALHRGVEHAAGRAGQDEQVLARLGEFSQAADGIRKTLQKAVKEGVGKAAPFDQIAARLEDFGQHAGQITEALRSGLAGAAADPELLKRIAEEFAGFNKSAGDIYQLLQKINEAGLHFHLKQV